MSKLNIKPLFDLVLIKPLEGETKTPGGILTSGNRQRKTAKSISHGRRPRTFR